MMQGFRDQRTFRYGQAAAILAGLTLCTVPAQGDLIQFTFTGEITEINGDVPEPWESADLGDPWEVSYVFDSEAEDQIPSHDAGRWYLESFTVTMAGFSSTTSIGEIYLELNSPPPLDHYFAYGLDLPTGGGHQ